MGLNISFNADITAIISGSNNLIHNIFKTVKQRIKQDDFFFFFLPLSSLMGYKRGEFSNINFAIGFNHPVSVELFAFVVPHQLC